MSELNYTLPPSFLHDNLNRNDRMSNPNLLPTPDEVQMVMNLYSRIKNRGYVVLRLIEEGCPRQCFRNEQLALVLDYVFYRYGIHEIPPNEREIYRGVVPDEELEDRHEHYLIIPYPHGEKRSLRYNNNIPPQQKRQKMD